MIDPSTIPRHLDGNAVAGALAQLFGTDVTHAMGTCRLCGHRAAVGQTRAYVGGPGVVLRCPECETVLMRWATGPTAVWLQMPGLRSLEIAIQS
jgi:hypothetical protein